MVCGVPCSLFVGAIESAAFTPSQSNQPASQPKELNLHFLAPYPYNPQT